MSKYPFTAADLEALRAWDTPTICNALEVVAPHRRNYGFTVRPMVAVDRKLPPICGLARTGTQRAAYPRAAARKPIRRCASAGMNMSPMPPCRPLSACRIWMTPRRRRLLG